MTQAERTALSDNRMFHAALALISEQGAHRTTLKDICEAAGYSRGLASYRYGSKEVFLREVMGHFNKGWERHLRRHLVGKRGYDAFIAAMGALEDYLTQEREHMRGVYLIWYEAIGGDNDVRAQLQENHAVYRRDCARWVRDGIADGSIDSQVDPSAFAMLYCSFVFGTIYQWLVDPDAMDIPELFAHFRQMAKRLLQPG